MAKNDDEIQTADYKTTASGRKVRAHRIVFNKGEEDESKLREECMKKNYKSFVAKYGKNRAVKEEVEQLDELSNDTIKAAIKVHAQKASHHASAAEDALDRHRETDHDSDYEEHEHHAEREEHHMNKIAKLKSKLKEELKGDQHKLDKNKNGKLDKHDFKLLRKEEAEQIDELSTDKLKAYKAAAQNDRAEHHDSKNSGDREEAEYAKKKIVKRTIGIVNANKRLNKEEAQLEEGWDDMVAHGKKTAAAATKTSTATKHDVKKTSTGTVYTKQRDADGNSKEFKRDADEAKRGRGRPKKNSFSEAAEFLMSLDEATFDSLMEDGFDTFAEQFEQLDELSKSTLATYIKKSSRERGFSGLEAGASGSGTRDQKDAIRTMKKRQAGVIKAVDRLTK